MPRSYRHMQDYEKEIMELREQGLTGRQIQEKFGFSKKQYENFITRYNRRQDKIAAGIALKRKGRPPNDFIVSEQDKVAELKYILARKERERGGAGVVFRVSRGGERSERRGDVHRQKQHVFRYLYRARFKKRRHHRIAGAGIYRSFRNETAHCKIHAYPRI